MNSQLEAKIRAINKLNLTANKLVVELQLKFAPLVGKDILKKDGTLLAKYSDFNLNLGHPFRSWRLDSKLTLGWTIDVTEKTSDGSNVYQQTDFSIGEISGTTLIQLVPPYVTRRTDYKYDEIIDLRQKKKAAQSLVDDYKAQLARFGDYDR